MGLAKSYKVYPGDKVKIEAYAKYANPTGNSSNVSAFASALLNAFLLPAPVGGELGTASSALNSWGSVVAAGGDGQSNTAPHVSVNIILFDKNYKFLDAAYDQIAGTAQQVGVSPVLAHDYMTREYTVKEEGYVFMYIANENQTQVDAYFDDVAMTYTPTSVVQYNEYYPFGLQASTSWTRESNSNNYLYNAGNELNSKTGWYETFFRGYDPALGRFMQVDPMATKYASHSSYNYGFNNPIYFNDPNGADARAEIDKLLNNSDYGGTWSEDGGINYFTSHLDAFYGGAEAIDASNGWGYTTRGSFEGSAKTYGIQTGTVPIRSVTFIDHGNGSFGGEPYTNPYWLQNRIDEHYIDYGAWFSKQTDQLQSVFSNIGMIPILGEVFDGINAGIYALRGDYGNAALSSASMLPIVGYAAPGLKLLTKGSKALHKHHVLSQTFKPWFKSRGISNIDDFTIAISESTHLKGVHGNGLGNLPGKWNNQWADFIDLNPNATPSEIFHQAEGMLGEFGLEHLPYLKYK